MGPPDDSITSVDYPSGTAVMPCLLPSPFPATG
jgi:hypothetical protein